MKKSVVYIIMTLCLISNGALAAAPCFGAEPPGYVFVRAVVDSAGPVFIAKDGRKYPLLEKIETADTASAEIAKLLDAGMPKISLGLGQYAKKFMHSAITSGAAKGTAEVYLEPLYIHVKKGGNMPQCGFFLRENGRDADKTQAYYIEMPPDPTQFETIFAHENGHLIDYYLGDLEFRKRPVRFVHTAPAVTDYLTAYVEGWGIHFETLTADLTANAAARAMYTFDGAKGNAYFIHAQDPMNLAHKSKRYFWVKSNLFAFQRVYRACPGETAENSVRNFVYNWMSADYDSGAVRNAQQMLSSEGVAATFFYRLVCDPAVQKRYRDREFYAPFLSGDAAPDPAARFTPLENAYLKIIFAKHELLKNYAKDKLESGGPLLFDFAAQYARSFPEDSKDVLTHFYMTTYFTTVLDDASALYRNLDCGAHFTLFDPALPKAAVQEAFNRIQGVLTSAATAEVSARCLGEPLWIQNDRFDLGEKDSPMTLSINLNAAEKFELLTLPGVDAPAAERFLARREKSIFFKSIDEIAGTGVFSAPTIGDLKRMKTLYETAK